MENPHCMEGAMDPELTIEELTAARQLVLRKREQIQQDEVTEYVDRHYPWAIGDIRDCARRGGPICKLFDHGWVDGLSDESLLGQPVEAYPGWCRWQLTEQSLEALPPRSRELYRRLMKIRGLKLFLCRERVKREREGDGGIARWHNYYEVRASGW